jgi:hypothetical protein
VKKEMARQRSTVTQPRLLKESTTGYGLGDSNGIDEVLAEDDEREMTSSASTRGQAWALDQLAKSEFFHQKLHEWGILEVATQIEQIRGEDYEWTPAVLNISEKAWTRVVHGGIKPVTVFAHPQIITTMPRAVAYYRMLAMVSQKSMIRVDLSVANYENGGVFPSSETAELLARHLNNIISHLVETDTQIEPREFDLWRGMAAGSQAQGSWGNTKGDRIEVVIRGMLLQQLRERELIETEAENGTRISLNDGRVVVIADEPDVAIYRSGQIEVAIEIKGGIDPAGVLERIGAAVKSLGRAKRENPESKTVLIIQGVSMTSRAYEDLEGNHDTVNHCFLVEDVLDDAAVRDELLSLIQL